MSAQKLRRILASLLAAASCLAFAGPAGAAPDQALVDGGLRNFLQHYAKDQGNGPPDEETRYLAVPVKLNDAGPASGQVLVYLVGPVWCGSGGCELLVLDRVGVDYKIITDVSIVHPAVGFWSPSPTNGATSVCGLGAEALCADTKPVCVSAARPTRTIRLSLPAALQGRGGRK
jgi:hypothetical protein